MRPLRLVRPALTNLAAGQRRCISDTFVPGDLVLLKQKVDRSAAPILTRPLQHQKRIDTHRGAIHHDDIIGKRVRDVVRTVQSKSGKDGIEYRLFKVPLDDYVRLSKRLVTPIYPADASLIVSLLDLHPDDGPHGDDNASKLEILEAGTGHGALTLYLSRAIHAANAGLARHSTDYESDDWKRQRKAVIHTTDVNPRFSEHARTVVNGFRNGLYARNVDFYVGDVGNTLQTLRDSRGPEKFLSHAILDLPAAGRHLAAVADALKTDGTLIVFNPSITQITGCATQVKDDRMPLDLDSVIELGVNGGSGGREWDVRFVHPRSTQSEQAAAVPVTEAVEASTAEGPDSSLDGRVPIATDDVERTWSLVCRPKVGERITGGGFLGVWKKQRDMRA